VQKCQSYKNGFALHISAYKLPDNFSDTSAENGLQSRFTVKRPGLKQTQIVFLKKISIFTECEPS